MRIISRTQSRRTAAAVRLLDHLDLVGPLHQLVDLGAHRGLDDLEQALASSARCRPRAADVQRPDARWLGVAPVRSVEHARDLVVAEGRPRAGARASASVNISCAHGQRHCPAWTPTSRRVPRADATAEPNSV